MHDGTDNPLTDHPLALRDDQGVAHALALAKEQARSAPAIGESKPLKYSLAELRQIGEIMFASGMFKDLKSIPQAMVKLLAGAELGYGPFQSLRAFHVIEGKPVETSGEITARIKRSGKYRMETYFIDEQGAHLNPITTKTAMTYGCVVLIHEKIDDAWIPLEPVVFTKDDAKEAGLLSKQVWKSYLRDMLFARTLTAAARRHCADLFGGPIYGPEELGADVSINSDGDQTVAAFQPQTPPPEERPRAPQPNLIDRRKKLLADVHALIKERGIARAEYLCELEAVFPEKFREPAWPEGKEPSSAVLGEEDLQKLIEHLSAIPSKAPA